MDVVVLTGGLGPTDDDVTRDVVAETLGRPMRQDPEVVERLRSRFARRGLQMRAGGLAAHIQSRFVQVDRHDRDLQ